VVVVVTVGRARKPRLEVSRLHSKSSQLAEPAFYDDFCVAEDDGFRGLGDIALNLNWHETAEIVQGSARVSSSYYNFVCF
jgi:hypothetical protein